MKKLIGLLVLLFATTGAFANGHRIGPYSPSFRHHHSDWIAPVIIGGVIGYALSQQKTPQAQPTMPTCPMGTYPIYEKIWIQDPSGRLIPADRFLGCK